MPVFQRRKSPPKPQKDYTQYRPLVREDFSECCAYCFFHERLAAGADNFQLDHFRPKSLREFAHLISDFYNLYYSCSVCNRYKSNSWPDPGLQTLGFGFVDPCMEDFSAHFREDEDGSWSPLTPKAAYTEARLRLNREHLVELRRWLRGLARYAGEDPFDWDKPCRDRVLRLIQDG